MDVDLTELLTRREFDQETGGNNIPFVEHQKRKREAFSKLDPWDGKTYIYVRLVVPVDRETVRNTHHLIKANNGQDALRKLVWAQEVCQEDVKDVKVATFEDVVKALKFVDDVTQFEVAHEDY